MSERTPGPWRIERFHGSRHSRIQPATGMASGGSLADVYGNDANAHLIAAAPDLLAARSQAREWVAGHVGNLPASAVKLSRVLDAAIAKAELK